MAFSRGTGLTRLRRRSHFASAWSRRVAVEPPTHGVGDANRLVVCGRPVPRLQTSRTAAQRPQRPPVKIVISAPIQVERLADWLPPSIGTGLPVGFGGVPSTTLALGLLVRGHELVIVTLDPNIEAPIELRGNRIEVRVYPSRQGGRARDYFRLERAYIRRSILEVANRVDVVSAHWAYEFALGALSTQVPTAVHLHDWAPAQQRFSPRGSARIHFAVKAVMTLDVMHRSHHLSAVSPYIAHRAQRWAHGPVTVIPNPIPVDDFLELPRRRPPMAGHRSSPSTMGSARSKMLRRSSRRSR